MEFLSGNLSEQDLSTQELKTKLKNLNKILAGFNNLTSLSKSQDGEFKNFILDLLTICKNQDSEIKLLVCCCFVDTLRIVAPVEILSANQIKKIMNLICESLEYLNEPGESTFPQILHVLRILADTSSLILVVRSNNISVLIKFIEKALSEVAENCGHTAEMLLAENFRVILEEMNEISDSCIIPILRCLDKVYKNKAKFRICYSVFAKCNSHVRNFISNYMTTLFIENSNNKTVKKTLFAEKYYIAYIIYNIKHDYLIGVLCSISELMKNKNSTKLLKMVSKIASCKKTSLYNTNSHLFNEFLKHFNSPDEEIRILLITFTEKFIINNREVSDIISKLIKLTEKKLSDPNEKVRIKTIITLSHISILINLKESLILSLCERLQDIKKSIRKLTLEELSKVYKIKCSNTYAIENLKDSVYSHIIDHIVLLFTSSEPDEQNYIVNALEDIAIDINLTTVQRVKSFCCMVEDLSDKGKEELEKILICKKYWGDLLMNFLSNEINPESVENFSGVMKLGFMQMGHRAQKCSSGPVYDVLSDADLYHKLKIMCGNSSYEEKSSMLNDVKGYIENTKPNLAEGFSQIKSRCLNFFITIDQIPLVLQNFQVLSLIGRCFPNYVIDHMSQILSFVTIESAKIPILKLLQKIQVRIFPFHTAVEEFLDEIFNSGTIEQLEQAAKVIKNMDENYAEKLYKNSLESNDKSLDAILSFLLKLKKLGKFFPEIGEKYKFKIKKLACDILEDKTSSIEFRVLSVGIIKNLIKYIGAFREGLFKYLRKLCVNMRRFFEKRVKANIDECLESIDYQVYLRKVVCKAKLSILAHPDCKLLLTHDSLTCLSLFSQSPIYSDYLAELLYNNLYKKSTMLPPLLSILGLLLPSNNKKCKDTLTQVLRKMKIRAEEQDSPDNKLKLMPEAYLPYLLFTLSRIKATDKTIGAVITGYLKCLLSSHNNIDVGYLLFVSNQLKKFKTLGKEVKTDIVVLPDKNADLEKICSDFVSFLIKNNADKEIGPEPVKVLIPTTYFEKQDRSKFNSEYKSLNDDNKSGLKRKVVETSPKYRNKKL
ncbi:hypothetical protein SteCoe_36555 [Stentor coeruleus]|uniref:Sister chromatid cohesion protein n=1 Tax=Stentor coeruleus TaxID=5963 RepID=A0A1R2APU3_9CILI|nr:hypothetical protein SteCoe_36555 [Stentor coeruleus]